MHRGADVHRSEGRAVAEAGPLLKYEETYAYKDQMADCICTTYGKNDNKNDYQLKPGTYKGQILLGMCTPKVCVCVNQSPTIELRGCP